jgi:hypothetical protein
MRPDFLDCVLKLCCIAKGVDGTVNLLSRGLMIVEN